MILSIVPINKVTVESAFKRRMRRRPLARHYWAGRSLNRLYVVTPGDNTWVENNQAADLEAEAKLGAAFHAAPAGPDRGQRRSTGRRRPNLTVTVTGSSALTLR